MINKLYISSKNHNWTESNSILINRHNIDKIISKTNAVDCHTSPEDIFCENLSTLFDNANEIILVDLDESISTTNDNFFSYGRLFNETNRHKNKVSNSSQKSDRKFLEDSQLNNTRNNTPVLWTAGCSVTVGLGVQHSDRWGTLLSNHLQRPEVSVAKAGSSMFWAADQLLRSDIRKDDIVVWALTNLCRVQVSENWLFKPVTTRNYDNLKKEHQYWTLDYFSSETLVLTAVREILQVINFCQKCGAQLYLVNVLDIAWLGVALADFANFLDLTQDLKICKNTIQFIDLGSDNEHPGPKQHQQYAEKIYNFIQKGT